MIKVLALGTGKDFAVGYGEFMRRHGYELDPFKSRKSSEYAHTILLVGGERLTDREADAAVLLSGPGRQMPVIVIDGGGKSAGLKKIASLARYNLPGSFRKMDLLAALKGCREDMELREGASALKKELSHKTDELNYFLDITRTLASSLEFPVVLAKIMERTRSMVGAESWCLMLMNQENRELVFESAMGVTGKKTRRFRIKVGQGIAGWAVEDRAPKLVPDVSKEKRFDRKVDRTPGRTTRSVMAVPIIIENRLLGVMELINKSGGGAFDKEDLRLVNLIIDQTALAIERSDMYQRMADLVITDDLTKLFNLRYLDRTLEVELERALRYNLPISLIFMDVDYFKKVNDQFGHLVGSKLLVEVSRLLLRGLRKVDIVARYGGDEFVVVLPQTDAAAAKMIAERLRRNIEKHSFLASENLGIRLTASFGIACYPEHAKSKEELMRLADEAMYRVKYCTRNSVYVVGSE